MIRSDQYRTLRAFEGRATKHFAWVFSDSNTDMGMRQRCAEFILSRLYPEIRILEGGEKPVAFVSFLKEAAESVKEITDGEDTREKIEGPAEEAVVCV